MPQFTVHIIYRVLQSGVGQLANMIKNIIEGSNEDI